LRPRAGLMSYGNQGDRGVSSGRPAMPGPEIPSRRRPASAPVCPPNPVFELVVNLSRGREKRSALNHSLNPSPRRAYEVIE